MASVDSESRNGRGKLRTVSSKRTRDHTRPATTVVSPDSVDSQGTKRRRTLYTHDPELASSSRPIAPTPSRALPAHKSTHWNYHLVGRRIEEEAQQYLWPLCQQYTENVDGYGQNSAVKNKMDEIISCLAEIGRYEEAKPVAIIGPTGAGKSTLVGQIIHSPGAVITSDGNRGTDVPIVYSAGTPGQQAPFVIKPEFYGLQELLDKVSQHVGHIRAYLSACDETKAASSQDPNSAEATAAEVQQESLETQHEESLDTLISILYDSESPDFGSKQALQLWLSQEDVKDTLNGHVEIIWKALDVQYPPKSCQDTDGLWKYIQDLSSETQTRSPRAMLCKLWVYTKVSQTLPSGLKIVDVPGLDDTEDRLTEYTSETLRDCHAVFLVVSTLRYRNQVLKQKKIIRRALGAGKPLFLVVSRIDQRDRINLAREKGFLPSDVKAIKDGQREVSQRKKAFDFMCQNEQSYEDLQDAMQEIEIAKMELLETEVRIRNRLAEFELKAKLTEQFPMDFTQDLRIFFVSATENAKCEQWHLSMKSQESPKTSQEATGIPKLRQAMYDLVDKPKCRQLEELCGQRVPTHLDGLIGILSKCKQDNERQTRNQLVGVLSSLSILYKAVFKKKVHQMHRDYMMAFDNNQSVWADQMVTIGEAWGNTHTATYHAYCRKYGKHRSPYKGVSKKYWDRQIQDIMQPEIDSANVKAQETMEYLRGNVDKVIETYLNQLGLDIMKIDGLKDGQDFVAAIKTMKHEIGARLRRCLDRFELETKQLRNKLVVQSDDSYIAKVLRPAYKAANSVKPADCQGPLSRAERNMDKKFNTLSQRALRERIRTMQKAFTGMDNNKMPRSEREKDKHFVPGLRKQMDEHLQNASTTCLEQLGEALAPVTTKCTDLFDTKYRIIGEVQIDEGLADELMKHAQAAREGFVKSIKPMLEECCPEEGQIVEE